MGSLELQVIYNFRLRYHKAALVAKGFAKGAGNDVYIVPGIKQLYYAPASLANNPQTVCIIYR
ncbi:hypothetical protein D3C87_2067190 [compost metagenome]